MAKEERDAPKAQVQSYFVFNLYFGDGVQRYSHLTYLSMNNKRSIIYRNFSYLYTKGIEHHKNASGEDKQIGEETARTEIATNHSAHASHKGTVHKHHTYNGGYKYEL